MTLIDFATVETAQVWMLIRDGGEAAYIEPGGAAQWAHRAHELRCPAQDCTGPVSIIGPRDRRHHFRHRVAVEHVGGSEGIFHIEAKTMMAQWFADHAPEHSTALLEQVPAGTNRRADVLVRVPGAPELAVEVEYKNFDIDQAEAKDEEYRTAGLDCLWLIGHSHLQADSPTHGRLPQFAANLRARGARVLLINPTTRELATLVDPRDKTRPWSGKSTSVAALVHQMGECRFDEHLWVRTPSDDMLEAAAEARAAQEAQDAADAAAAHARALQEARLAADAARAEAERLAAEAARERAEIQAQRRIQDLAAAEAQRARADYLRETALSPLAACLRLPVVYTPVEGEEHIDGDPLRWRAAVFAECVMDKPNWATFGWRDIRAALTKHRVPVAGRWRDERFETLKVYLRALEHDGWIFVVDGRTFAASGKKLSM